MKEKIKIFITKHGTVMATYLLLFMSLGFYCWAGSYDVLSLVLPEMVIVALAIILYLFRGKLHNGLLLIPMLGFYGRLSSEGELYFGNGKAFVLYVSLCFFLLLYLAIFVFSLIQAGSLYKDISWKANRLLSFIIMAFSILLCIKVEGASKLPKEIVDPHLLKVYGNIFLIQGLTVAQLPKWYSANIRSWKASIEMGLGAFAGAIILATIDYGLDGSFPNPVSILVMLTLLYFLIFVIRINVIPIFLDNDSYDQYTKKRLFVSSIALKKLEAERKRTEILLKQEERLSEGLKMACNEAQEEHIKELIAEVDEELCKTSENFWDVYF